MASLLVNPGTPNELRLTLDEASPTRIGRSAGNEVCLDNESVSGQHARIEHRQDGWYVVDLESTNGTMLNDAGVSFQKLAHEDRLLFGDVPAVFLLPEPAAAAAPAEPTVEELPAQELALAPVVAGRARCMRCGAELGADMRICPYCGAPAGALPALASDYIPPAVTPTAMGAGVLPVIAFLAALTVIGFPVAIVLGLMSLSVIRRRGGTVRDRNMAQWSVGLGTLWLMLALALGAWVTKRRRDRDRHESARTAIEANEVRVIAALKGLARAEKYACTIEFRDADADGNGEYAPLAELAAVGSRFFDETLADGSAYGYRFFIKETSERNFHALAEPLEYGRTGLRSFAVDRSGQIRGKDLGGQRLTEATAALPVLANEQNAYHEVDEEIAGDALNVLKRLPDDPASREKRWRILERLRKEFTLTEVGRQLIGGVADVVDRDVTEYRAEALYAQARRHMQAGEDEAALAVLGEIAEDYAGFSKIAEVGRAATTLRSQIAERHEREARELFAKAEALERDGRSEAAHQLYQKIEKHYPQTDVAVRIAELKPELQRSLREKNAEEVFAEMMELSPEREFRRILNLSTQLQRNYADTDLFGKNREAIDKKQRKARSAKWRLETLDDMNAGRSRGALARLEAALREDPDLAYDLRDVLIRLYHRVAAKLVEEKDAREALRMYTNLQKLLQGVEDSQQVPPELMAKLHNEVGQSEFERGDYASARWHLANAAWFHGKDAQFNLRLGIANLHEGLYMPALEALSRAVALNPGMDQAYLYRTYLNVRYVGYQERALRAVFEKADASESANRPADGAGAGASGGRDAAAPAGPDEGVPTGGVASAGAFLGASRVTAPASADEPGIGQGTTIPDPRDKGIALEYNYQRSSRLLPALIDFIRRLHDAKSSFRRDMDRAKGKRKGSVEDVKMRQYVQITKFRNEMSNFRARTAADATARDRLIASMKDVHARLEQAALDLRAARKLRQEYAALSERLLAEMQRKGRLLATASALISGSMRKEVRTQNKALEFAEVVLKQVQAGSRTGLDVPRFLQDLVQRSGDRGDLDRGLMALRKSTEEPLDAGDVFRAVQGQAVPQARAE